MLQSKHAYPVTQCEHSIIDQEGDAISLVLYLLLCGFHCDRVRRGNIDILLGRHIVLLDDAFD